MEKENLFNNTLKGGTQKMVTKKQYSPSLGKDIAALYSMGLQQDEIMYLMHAKLKMMRARKKWD